MLRGSAGGGSRFARLVKKRGSHKLFCSFLAVGRPRRRLSYPWRGGFKGGVFQFLEVLGGPRRLRLVSKRSASVRPCCCGCDGFPDARSSGFDSAEFGLSIVFYCAEAASRSCEEGGVS